MISKFVSSFYIQKSGGMGRMEGIGDEQGKCRV